MSEIRESAISTDQASEPAELVKLSRKQLWRASVSLEFDLLPVLTWRGEIQAGTPAGAANRAVRAARKTFRGKKPRSWAIVVEKL
jgi:hypothetical protein